MLFIQTIFRIVKERFSVLAKFYEINSLESVLL
jgi:hypothetical protein